MIDSAHVASEGRCRPDRKGSGICSAKPVLPQGVVAEPAMAVALGYSAFWLAYVPRGPILSYNRLGDYSYGVYIYAFPVQGLAVWMFGAMTAIQNILIALPVTVLCAVVSWHFIEAPALDLRYRFRASRGDTG